MKVREAYANIYNKIVVFTFFRSRYCSSAAK
jgi:hypothetical protein